MCAHEWGLFQAKTCVHLWQQMEPMLKGEIIGVATQRKGERQISIS